jgi:hypothetical protein
MKGLLGGLTLAAAVAVALAARAQGPMTPVRPTAPPTSAAAPQWVNPPVSQPGRGAVEPSTTEAAGPEEAEPPARHPRHRHYARHFRHRHWHYARRVWSGSAVSYSGGFGPAPYSDEGD